MPRGQKSKLRAREKRRQARQAEDETQGLEGAQAVAAEVGDTPSSASPIPGERSQNLPAAETCSTPKPPRRAAAVSCTGADERASSQDEQSPSTSKANESSSKDPLQDQLVLLVQFLVKKYQKKELIMKAEMLKSITTKSRCHFHELLNRATEYMEVAFGLDLREVDPIRHCYALVNKMNPSVDEMDNDEGNMPKTGILMIVLAVILVKGNRATEEEVWKVLNMIGIYADRNHVVFGDAKKLITQDLVQLKYLEYRHVPNSNPPCYEFLWGPRAYAETSKMKVLEFLARINKTTPSAFPSLYEEAVKDEEERARAR
ncbi:melanoma-associated antigen B18-like, partial [Orycteropus afer afer]|uniref:Melanoma-associated antigen B18-like n=1 Tax=Orycteropus afer afer TaxID=1230840 RepID=A0A8B7BBZ0_ORYAF